MKPIGSVPDTPVALRARATEFLRLAKESKSKNPFFIEEMHKLAALYLERARDLETGAWSRRRGAAEARHPS